MTRLIRFFSSEGLVPMGEAFDWRADFVWTYAVTDAVIFLSLIGLIGGLYLLTKRAKIAHRGIILGFTVFIVIHAACHLLSLITIWHPWYWAAALLRIGAAISGLLTVFWVFQFWPELLSYGTALKRLRDDMETRDASIRQAHFSNDQFEKLLKRSVFLPIAMSLVLIIVLTSQITYIVEVKSEVSDLTKRVTRYNALQWRFSESENSVRGYLLTKDPVFFESLREAQSRIPYIIDVLMQETEKEPESRDKVEAVTALYKKWSTMTEDLIAREKTGAKITTDEHMARREFTLQARAIFKKLIENTVAQRDNFSQDADHATYLVILGTVSLSGLIGFLLALWSRRQILTLSRNYTDALGAVQELNASLEQKVLDRTEDLNTANLALSSVNHELEAFSYSVSHDLRGPLRGIDGFSKILIEDYSDRLDTVGIRHLNFIRDGVRRMGQLIDDLLKLSRITKADVKTNQINVSLLLKDIIKHIRAENPNHQVTVTMPDQIPMLADEDLLRIILQNLINNAWKFTAKVSDPKVEITAIQEEGYTGLVIQDNGAGFDMTFVNKLFQTFQRLHSAKDYEGSGIGLAICKRIVQRHGGRISASGELGKGARFELFLPTTPPQVETQI